MIVLDENQGDAITEALIGHRIIAAEMGRFDAEVSGDRYGNPVTGRLTLDDGTRIYVAPNQGGCSCGAGDYDLTHLATVDNIITSVRLVNDPDDDDLNEKEHEGYRVYVVADAVEINAVQIDGSDGNGYYGTGYALIVLPADHK